MQTLAGILHPKLTEALPHIAMPKRSADATSLSSPSKRKFLGGHSERGGNRAGGPGTGQWTAAAASAAAKALVVVLSQREDLQHGVKLFYHVLTDAAIKQIWESAVADDATAASAQLARSIFEHWREQCRGSTGQWLRLCRVQKKLKAAFDQLQSRARTHGVMGGFFVAHTDDGVPVPATALGITAVAADTERRPCEGGRIMRGLALWDWSAFDGVAFVNFERAAGRLRSEYPEVEGAPSPDLVERLVCRDHLRTALASPGDHYLVLRARPEGGMPDVVFMAVGDSATAGGVPSTSPLRDALLDPTVATPVQAVTALGEAVQGDVFGAILDTLVSQGAIPEGECTWATAFSGIDVPAAVAHARFGHQFRYAFGSEPVPHRRRALLRAWGEQGLTESRLYTDARDPAARREAPVDVFVITPVCQPFSKRNHARDAREQARALADTYAALDYARLARPKVVIVENVEAAELREHMDMMLLAIPGYAWRRATIDPREVGGFAARLRSFWVGVRAVA